MNITYAPGEYSDFVETAGLSHCSPPPPPHEIIAPPPIMVYLP